MKITSFYYLAYPDCLPPDPLLAEGEVYVEVGDEGDSQNAFKTTYSVWVCTIAYLRLYLKNNPAYCHRSLIIVERFEDPVIKNVLESLLPFIDRFGEER